MKDEEKNLIENLFHRLKNTELNSSEKDSSADDLIQKLVAKQPSSSYYMAQTILIQETAIKKMSKTIEELKDKIKQLQPERSNEKPSFLSNFFNKKPSSKKVSDDNDIWKNKDRFLQPNSSNMSRRTEAVPTISSSNTSSSNKSSGFLSNALQTATGVAGGMILGNMLMNIFNHTKPEQEVFETMNKSSEIHDTEEHIINNNNLVNYEYNDEPETYTNESFLEEDMNSNISSIDEANISNDIGEEVTVDDDNFI